MGKALAKPKTKAVSFSQDKLDKLVSNFTSILDKRVQAECQTIFYEIKMSIVILGMSEELLKDKKRYANQPNTQAKKTKAWHEKLSQLTGFRRDKVVKYRKQGKWAQDQSWYNSEFLGLDKDIDWLDDKNESAILDKMTEEYKHGFLAKQSEDFLKRNGNLHPETRETLKGDYYKLSPAKKKTKSTTSTNTPVSTPATEVADNTEELSMSEVLESIGVPTTEIPNFDVDTTTPENVADVDDIDTLLELIKEAIEHWNDEDCITFKDTVIHLVNDKLKLTQ